MKTQSRESISTKFNNVIIAAKNLRKVKGGKDIIIIEEVTQG